jgi:AcrR family transcriptional regulator
MLKNIRAFSDNSELVAQRREQIAERAGHLFANKGYGATSVQKIADACGMSVGNLYRYVGSKKDIIYLIVDELATRASQIAEEISINHKDNPTESLRRIIRLMCEVYDQKQDIVMLVYHDTRNLARRARERCFDTEKKLIASIEELLARGNATGEFQIDNVTLVAHHILVNCQMWAIRRWFLKHCCTLEEYIENQIELINHGICKGKTVATVT